MSTLTRALPLLVFCCAATAAPITDLKPLYPRTELASGGEARCAIVTPERVDMSGEAEMLADRVEQASGARPEIVRADRAVSEAWQPDHEVIAGRNLVALGNANSNRLLAVLHGRQLVCSDSIFPGEGGYVIRTVHDPFATGVNVLVLAGSDAAGVARAVEMFAERYIGDRADIVLEQPVVDVQFTPTYHRFYPEVTDWSSSKRQPLYSTIEYFREYLAGAGLMDADGNVIRKESGSLTTVTGAIARIAETWWWTGDPALPPLMKQVLDANRHLLAVVPERVEMEAASAAHVQWWDIVEELPVWTDQDRLQITNALLADALQGHEKRAAHRLVNEGYVQVVDENHGTNSALNTYMAWQYFDRYYDLPETEYWMKVVSATFSGQCSSHQILEDAAGYLCYAPEDAIIHALWSGDLCYMDRGVARTQAEFIAQASVSNLGLATGFGDAADLVYPGIFQVIARAGWYYKDPSLLWVAYNVLHPNCGLRVYQNNIPVDLTVATEPPAQWTGMNLLPIYRQTLRKGDGAKEPVFDPKESVGDEWFNKIVFREAWDADAQYLLLDGCGSFHDFEGYPKGPSGHRHDDINTIPCFTDEGRMWLVDHTYGARAIKEHSGLYITRDGTLSWADRLAKVQSFAGGKRLNLSRTTFEQYSGATWERTIFWRVGEHFAVIDRAIAQEPGHYVVRCSFRGLGEHSLDGDRMRLEQDGRFCQIVSDGLAETAVETFAQPSAEHWESFYPHAEPVAKIFQQDKSRALQPGDSLTFANAFAASADEAELDDLKVAPASDTCVVVDSASGAAVYGLGELPGGGGEADAYALIEDAVLLAGATRVGDLQLAAATDLYLDADGLVAEAPGIDVEAAAAALPALSESALAAARRMAASYQPPRVDGTLADVPVAETEEIALGTPVNDMTVADLDGDGADEWIVVGQEGAAAFAADGSRLWSFAPGASCSTLDAADIDGDGAAEVVVGCEDFRVYALSGAGEELWSFECKPGTASLVGPPIPEMVRIADLEGDGTPEIIVGANWTHCLTPSGEVRWEQYLRFSRGRICGDFSVGEIADIDGDGQREVVALYEDSYHKGVVYAPDGEMEIPNDGGYGVNAPYPNCVIALNLWGHESGGLHYVVGGNNQLIKYHGTGEFVNTNGGGTGGCYLQMADWQPEEGFPWLFASTDMGAVVGFRAEAERNDQWLVTPRQWATVVGERITALSVREADVDTRLLVGSNSGAVLVLDPSTGTVISRTEGVGSPVVRLIPSESHALAVHADGIVSRITP